MAVRFTKTKDATDENIKILHVPGSFELVYGCNSLIDKGYDAIIAIGLLEEKQSILILYVMPHLMELRI